ncbi:hypothetical protein BDR06DRAFT_1018458 [Suillus hirtellus]|nr:hypothetical protein BDR06DRAFT_1018458 [Suillus hirtellus]
MSGLDAIINRKAPSPWELFKTKPSLYMASRIYNTPRQQLPRPVFSRDLTHSGTPRELQVTFDWLVSLPHEHKIVIAGNHDAYLQTIEGRSWVHTWRDRGIIYLEDEAHTIQVRGRAFNIFGSPFTPQHGNGAFQYPHILITHGPPYSYLDLSGLGWRALLARIRELCRTHPPVLHVFGHIHGGRGIENMPWNSAQSIWEDIVLKKGGWFRTMHLLWAMLWGGRDNSTRTVAVNASVVGGPRDRDIRPPVVIDI